MRMPHARGDEPVYSQVSALASPYAPHCGGEPTQCLKYKIPQPKLEDFDSRPLKGAIFFEFLGCLRRLELVDNVGLTYHPHTAA